MSRVTFFEWFVTCDVAASVATCIHTYTHMHMHTHTHTHTHMYTHVHMHTHTHTHMYTHMHMHTHTHTHTHVLAYAHARTRTHTRTHICTRTRARTHTHVHTYAHVHARAHTHTHTHTCTHICTCTRTQYSLSKHVYVFVELFVLHKIFVISAGTCSADKEIFHDSCIVADGSRGTLWKGYTDVLCWENCKTCSRRRVGGSHNESLQVVWVTVSTMKCSLWIASFCTDCSFYPVPDYDSFTACPRTCRFCMQYSWQ